MGCAAGSTAMNIDQKMKLKRVMFWTLAVPVTLIMIPIALILTLLAALEEGIEALWTMFCEFEAWCFKERNARQGYKHIGDGVYRGGYSPEDE